ncbi:MAG TPA: phosphatase PAP2 family protein [Deinococcales bacterium]|nr:phosphatase PAP2 family protein [Deinococcales bacterium]
MAEDDRGHAGLLAGPALPLRSWLWLPAGAALFAAAVLFGAVASSYGPFTPELGVDAAWGRDRNPVLAAAALAVHYFLGPVGGVILAAAACAALLLRRRPLHAAAFGSITAAGWASSEAGKVLVGRLRPPSRAVHALVSETRPDSFPSGHTALAFALALAVVLVLAHTVRQRWAAGAAGVLFTAAVGLSRVYLGVHYPTDVIGSVLVGTAAMLVWLPVWNRAAGPRLAQALERRQGRQQPGPAGEGGRR